MNVFPITSEPVDLGKGFAVTFSFDGTRMDAEWSPRMPYGRRGRQLLPAYRRARHEFLMKVSQRLGFNIACVDVAAGAVQ